jgi:Tol biopolymer transport system component
MKDITEGKLRAAPTKLGQPQVNGNIDTLTVSPDGSRIVFSVLFNAASGSPRAQLMSIRSDGGGGEQMLTDGSTLDIMPSCTPDGTRIVFSSNRATNRMSVWEMAASGAPGMTQLTTGDNNDLWPVIDSDPKPRLFYQAHLDMRDLPKLFMTQLGTVARTDLTHLGGTQPRISPKADTLIFAAPNAKTGKRDLFRMPDSGGVPENMTNTPDIDEFDPAWSSDGTRIAFVSDRGMDADKRANYDIWTIDAANSTQPTQVTANGSWDDSPTWDPSGDAIYFRSNRGGEWAIWKINMR